MTLSGAVIGDSEAAILFHGPQWRGWVPRSVLNDGDLVEVGDTDIEVAAWWARQNGIEEA